MITHSLTGKKRLRCSPQLFREPSLVLQVEWQAVGYEIDSDGLETPINLTYWKDARLQDISGDALFRELGL